MAASRYHRRPTRRPDSRGRRPCRPRRPRPARPRRRSRRNRRAVVRGAVGRSSRSSSHPSQPAEALHLLLYRAGASTTSKSSKSADQGDESAVTPSRMSGVLVTDALEMAITHRNPSAGVIFHSDRGCQYTSTEFDQFCRNNNIRRSLGRTGICYDNAVSESFFATYKKELIHTRPWPTIKDLISRTFDWIESYYNRRRRHSTLGYLTPGEYELGYRDITELAA
ncbi:hypothetical protein EEB14_07900 [Rhodococcus sp. WS4]|nr:hypothetical protein EEB14_07900 [Rhodococcus sp. WS4]